MTGPYEVRATPVANRQIAGVRATVRRRYEQFEQEIAAQGCAAFTYRLTGEGVDHFCDRHLSGRWRVIAAFTPDGVVWVLLVGEHLRDQPEVDVYRQLYEVAGISSEPTEGRTKPACCTGSGADPDVDQGLMDELVDRSQALTGRRRGPGQRRAHSSASRR